MKKVLIINYSYKYGSTGRIVHEIAKRLDEQGVECLVYCKKTIGARDNLSIAGKKIGYLYAGLYSRISGLQGYSHRVATKKLIRMIDREQPDIIHIHNLHGNYINFNILMDYLGDKYNGKIVVTLHDCWLFTGNCAYFTVNGCYKWTNGEGCQKCMSLKKYPPSWLFDRTNRMFKDKQKAFAKLREKMVVTCVSQWLEYEAKRSVILKGLHFVNIYNSVNTGIFKILPREEVQGLRGRFKHDFLTISVASIWGDAKGLNKIYEFAKMADKTIGIILVGQCDQSIYAENIYYVGKISSQEELSRYYNISDCLLNLSEEETFGLTTAEAMACGIPAIVVDSTANPEIVGECGVVIKDTSPTSISQAIDLLRTNKVDADMCRERVKDKFSEDNYNKYIELYNKMLDC